MSKEQDNINAVAKVMDDGVDAFLDGVEKSQSGMFNKTLAIVKELETDINGNIKTTVKNLRLLTRVRKTIVDEILTESYQKRVKTFTNQYPAIQELNNGYFKGIEAAFNPNRELYNQIVQKSIQTTSASLLESGIDQNVIEPIIRIVDDSVSTGATFSDMVDELRLVMKGDPERLGKLMRYSTQITTDALNQFNGIYNETIAKDLDLEWYFYSGGIRRTSRPFCKKYAGRYFHKKEVEDFGRKKDLDGSNLCGGSTKTNLCAGRIPGTNKSNIFRTRAGFNCRHVYKPTLIDAVPKSVINRNIKKGYFVPEGEEIITKQPEFVPAKTIEEAEKFARDNFISEKSKSYILSSNKRAQEWLDRTRKQYPDIPAKNANFQTEVTYKGLSLDSANIINKRMSKLFIDNNTPKLAKIRSRRFGGKNKNIEAQMSNLGDIEVNSTRLKTPKIYEKAHEEVENTIGAFRKNIPLLEKKSIEGALSAQQDRMLTYAKKVAKFDRMTVSNKIENIIDHEIGHHIDNTKFIIAKNKNISEDWLNKKISSGMKQASTDKYKHSISNYAFNDIFVQRPEIFAETFAMYMKNEDKLIPPDLLEVFKKLITR